MPSATFQVCYASVTNTLFEHIEQDLLQLATAFLDDDVEVPAPFEPVDHLPPSQAAVGA